MSDHEQYDETGGPPPTPGTSGGRDGGTGLPGPQQHQGEGVSNPNDQTRTQQGGNDQEQRIDQDNDNQQDHRQQENHTQDQRNQRNTGQNNGPRERGPQVQDEQQRDRDQLVNHVRNDQGNNGTSRGTHDHQNFENTDGDGRDFDTTPGGEEYEDIYHGRDHADGDLNQGPVPQGTDRQRDYYPLDDQLAFGFRPQLSRNDSEFNKHAPKWHIGKSTWDVFQADFIHIAKRFGVKERLCKSVLYSHVIGEAKSLIVPHMDPDLPKFRSMRFPKYARELKAVFEPVHDAPMLRVAFATRTQGRYEHVLKYVQHKLTAFLAAYTQAQPPWFIYYDETTNGLLNKPLASELRRYRPQPANNYMGYRNHLSGLLHARHADYLSGILKDSDMVGIEIDVLMNPVDYKSSKPDSATVNSLTGGDTLNAMDQQSCYHCGQHGHMRRECPRKLSGMAPARGIENNQENSSQGTSVNQVAPTIEAMGNQKRRYIPYRIVRRSTGTNKSPSKYIKKRTISVLETEDGEYHVDPEQSENMEDSDQEEALSSQINTMSMDGPSSDEESRQDNGFQDISYCAESFLDV